MKSCSKLPHFVMTRVVMFFVLAIPFVRAGEPPRPQGGPLASITEADRAGRSFIATRVFSAEDDAKILKAFEGLRVADVTDGMDFVGLKNLGLMDPEIHPSWKDTKTFKHRFIGIALTVRYVPTQKAPPAAGMSYEQFRAAESKWYREVSFQPFDSLIRPGSDGVQVVPRDVALQVAEFAHQIIDADKAGRRDLYKRLGLPEDPSVK
ncbi:MAG: hypothetical protein ABIZ49_03990 [Opitutaceae bacterium]